MGRQLRCSVVAEGFHPPVEEYLKTVYELQEAELPPIRARLAERLHHTPPTVTEMVRRLIDEGYLEAGDRSLRMTDQGRRRAESVLTDVIGLKWYETHREAARWEHVISDEVEQRLVVVLGNPGACPHGNPIPGSGAPMLALSALTSAQPGQLLRLERVSETLETDLDTLCYLDAHALRPGAAAAVTERAPDGTLTLEVDGDTVAIGPSLAAQLYVATA